MSQFNPDTFLGGEVQGAMETKYTPIPEGDYPAFIEDVKAREANDQPILDILYKVTDEKLQAEMDTDNIIVRQSIFVDVDESGAIQFGLNKNVKLGNVREAVGQNDPKKAWAPMMLKGQGPVTIRVTQRPDAKDAEIIYNDVKRVTAG